MKFAEKLAEAIKKNNSLLCIGLDPDPAKLPASLKNAEEPLFAFNQAIIDATADLVSCFKPNSAFYEGAGEKGIVQLQKTCEYIREKYPDIPVILDFKRGDIGNTNLYYAQFAFDVLQVDAVTIHPYMGREANQPYLEYEDKGIFVLCRTSNPGAGEFQDLEVEGKKVYQIVAEQVAKNWNQQGNCHVVVGATYPAELAEIRATVGDDMIILSPGLGAQGGDIEKAVRAGANNRGVGIVFNTSRAVLFASANSDFADAARTEATKLRDEINRYR